MTVSWKIVEPVLGLPAIGSVLASTELKAANLGSIVKARGYDEDYGGGGTAVDYGEGEFIMLKGVGSTVRGSFVTYNPDDFSTTLLVPNAIGPVAVATAITDATTEYGWYQISGKGVGVGASGFADNGICYIHSGSAGYVDDTDVAGDYVYNCKGASAVDGPGTGLADYELARPFVNNGLDD